MMAHLARRTIPKRRAKLAGRVGLISVFAALAVTPASSQDFFDDLFGTGPKKRKEVDDTAPARRGGAVPERVDRGELPDLSPPPEALPPPEAARDTGARSRAEPDGGGYESQFDPLEARRNGYRNTARQPATAPAPAPSQYDNQDEFARPPATNTRAPMDWSDPPRQRPQPGQAMNQPPSGPAWRDEGARRQPPAVSQRQMSDPWASISIEDLEQSLAKIELPPRSAAVHSLWLQLITAPAGRGADPRLAAIRADALNRTGLTREASEALGQAGDVTADPIMATLAARTAIGAGNTQQGCEMARVLTSQVAAKLPQNLKAEVILIAGFCAAASDNKPAAGIAGDLAAENGLGNHAGPDALKAIAAGHKPALAPGKKVSLLDYRILQLSGPVDVTPALATASPALLAVLARDPAANPASRLAAAEAAASLNAISVEELAEAYRSSAGDNGANVQISDADANQGQPEHRAALFVAAEHERTPMRKARFIRAFLDDARRSGLYWPALQLMARPANELEPVGEISWFAESAVEASLAAGDYAAIDRWTDFASRQDGGARSDLRHWRALADIADTNAGGDRSRHLEAVEVLAQRGRLEPVLLHHLATVLDALDTNVPIPLWEAASRTDQPSTGYLPDTGVLSQLQDAAKQRDYARTVLLVMRTLGPDGAEGAHMIALGDSIRALKRAGLEPEARRLGLEALFSAWPRANAGN